MFEARLEDVAQLTGELDYDDAWKLNKKATDDPEFRKKVRAILNEYDDAVEMDCEDDMDAAGMKLKELVNECV
jgi:hypothetical protein